MATESTRVRDIADHLRESGYALVQIEARIPDVPRLHVDVLAWAADDAGELVPRVAVEVKRGSRPEVALPILAQIRASLGTVEHYVVADGAWFLAGRGLRAVEPVEGPAPLAGRASGIVNSVQLATELLQQRIWKEADRLRGHSDRVKAFVEAVSVSSGKPGIESASGDFVAVDPTVLWRARRAALASIAERDKLAGIHVSPSAIAGAVASLVGKRLRGTVVDPFCGSGSFLWELQDRAEHEGRQIESIGRDLNVSVIQAASAIGQTAPTTITFETADAFATPLPEADVIVTAPPMGLRLSEPHELQTGASTRHGDLAAVDTCLRALEPGGRAVFQIAPGMTFHGGQAEAFREFLASEYRVAALIGCPSGSAYGTQIKTVLMVIDKDLAGETFVAQLADDWETQLSPTGPAMTAALAHIDGAGIGAR